MSTKELLMLLWNWDTSFQKHISICHRVPSRNLKKDEGRLIMVKFVRRQLESRLIANKKSLEDCEEKNVVNDDNILLRARLAKALRLRAHTKSVVMLYEKVVIYKADESKIQAI